jgi:hypothetical protein
MSQGTNVIRLSASDLIADSASGEVPKLIFLLAANLKLEQFKGRAAQILPVGRYSTEGPTIKRLDEFIEEQGFTLDGQTDA